MAEIGLNVVGNQALITLTTDVTLYNVSDYDPRSGSNLTVAYRAFEPRLIIATNRNTASSSLVDLYDVDRTNAVTATGTPRYSIQLAAGETKFIKEDELQGVRFYLDVDVIASVITLWMAIFGHEVD